MKKHGAVKSETEVAREALEKAVKNIERTGLRDFTLYLQSPFKVVALNFLAGTFRGLGFFLGASLVLAVFAFIVSQVLVNIPVVGEFFSALLRFLQENSQFSNGSGVGG